MLRLFGLQPIELRWVINICLTTTVWFIAPIKYQGQYKVTVLIVLHFVKRFVWDCSFFTQYSYYRDLFCLGTELRLRDRHSHAWVRYIDTTKTTVWCVSSILIHMTYSVYTICISEHYRKIVSFSPTPSQQVSDIFWNMTITVWLQSQVHRVNHYFYLMHEIITSKNTETHYTVIILSFRARISEPQVVSRY